MNYDYYSSLAKPFFAPPAWVFGPVWTFLYVVIAVTYARIFYLAAKRVIPFKAALPFVLNLFFNLIFTYIQFGLQDNYLAAIDILLVLDTLLWGILAIKSYSRRLAYWQLPYLAWVIFATVLQLSVTWLNG